MKFATKYDGFITISLSSAWQTLKGWETLGYLDFESLLWSSSNMVCHPQSAKVCYLNARAGLGLGLYLTLVKYHSAMY